MALVSHPSEKKKQFENLHRLGEGRIIIECHLRGSHTTWGSINEKISKKCKVYSCFMIYVAMKNN